MRLLKMNPSKSSNKKTSKGSKRYAKKSLSPPKKVDEHIESLSSSINSVRSHHINGSNQSFHLNLSNISKSDQPIAARSQIASTSSCFQPAKLKNMRSRVKYQIVEHFDNETEADTYLRENNSYPFIIINNNLSNCTICHVNDDQHKMQSKYLKCSCKKEWCNLKYVIKRCCGRDDCSLSKSGIHADPSMKQFKRMKSEL